MQELEQYKTAIEAITDTFDKRQVKTLEDSISIVKDQCELLIAYFDLGKEEDKRWSVKYAILHLLPLLEKMLSSPKLKEQDTQSVYRIYRRCYAFCGRRSFQHFIIFMEWERSSDNMVYMNRKELLDPIVYYLNKMLFDEKLMILCASLPPSSGKTFLVNYYSAFVFGVNMDSSILRLSFSERNVNEASTSIKDLISSDLFSEVFTEYKEYRNKPFEKEKNTDWRIKNSDVTTSHYAITRDGATTGIRANYAIIFDDMLKGKDESNNDDLHNDIWSKYLMEWLNRKSSDNVKNIFVGTMWSPKDLINRIIARADKESKLIKSTRYKYVWESEDGHAVVIRIPLLDENDKSTCERVTKTSIALKIREESDPYEFSCVYQQDPIAPSGLEFAYQNLRTYTELPNDLNTYCQAVLDPTRKGKDNVSMPICCKSKDGELHYLIDWVYKKVAITEVYDLIVDKIIEHRILEFCIENNTDTSLKSIIELKLKEKNVDFCTITEKYNTAKKEVRIKDMRGVMLRKIVFKAKGTVSPNSDYGRAITAFTTYSFDYANKNDDAPDSLALYTSEIIIGKNIKNEIKAVNRSALGF